MAIFYLDFENGNDANDGTSWANAWKTITSGATAARIAPGDTIRIAKSPAPVSIGNAKWTGTTNVGGGFPATKAISSSTNASPVGMTVNGHGWENGDIIQITAHNTNTAANGVWEIANKTSSTFELVGSTGNGVGGATGTAQKINSKAVVLSTAQTKNIDRCEVAWTAANGGTVTLTRVTSDAKEGEYCMVVSAPASPSTDTLYAYSAIPETDFSGYQKMSFWIYAINSIPVNTWKICLCSDTAGTTIVDTFKIPAIGNQCWGPFTIEKNGGGNLGSSIQSIALYSDTSAPGGYNQIKFDNLLACTSAGLNLCSLISKNNLEQGGDEGWYGIQSINDTIVLIDHDTSTKSTQGRGYSGATETVPTYIRETIKRLGISEYIQDSGSDGNLLYFKGGFNTSSGEQDGETFFDGQICTEYGLGTNSCDYLHIDCLDFVRFYGGVLIPSGTTESNINLNNLNNNQIGLSGFGVKNTINIKNILNNGSVNISTGSSDRACSITLGSVSNSKSNNISINSSGPHVFEEITKADNNGGTGLTLSSSLLIKKIGSVSYNSSQAIYFSRNTIINEISNCDYNGTYALNFASGADCKVRNALTTGNASGAVNAQNNAFNSLENCLINESNEVLNFNYNSLPLYSLNHDQTPDNHWIFAYGGNINAQTTIRHTASGIAWKLSPNNSSVCDAWYPLKSSIAKVACNADALVTVKTWMRRSNTGLTMQLVCKGGQIAGVPDDVVTAMTAAADTWEEVTITFTPTVSGVVDIEVQAYGGTSYSGYSDGPITITQA